MKILLDECVPWPMHRLLAQHYVTSVQAQGWNGVRNSELLRRAEAEFDVFITSDQNIRYQQNLASHRVAIVELSTNDLHRIVASATVIERGVESIHAGEFKRLEIP